MRTPTILPIMISMGVIVLMSIFERHSKTIAAILTSIPLTATLRLWIVYNPAAGDDNQIAEFTRNLLIQCRPDLDCELDHIPSPAE